MNMKKHHPIFDKCDCFECMRVWNTLTLDDLELIKKYKINEVPQQNYGVENFFW